MRRRVEAQALESREHTSHHCRGAASPFVSSASCLVSDPVQLPHRPVSTIPRGGANTSDHVDVLGSQGVNEVILKVALGAGDEIEDSYVSRIREYVKRIAWNP